MKIAIIIEKRQTAIGRLADLTAKAAPWHEYKIVAVHPKRPSPDQFQAFEEAVAWCDVVDFRYWKTAELIRSMYNVTKPAILTHYNPYDLTRQSWGNYKTNVVVNQEQQTILKHNAHLVPLPIDLDFWDYRESAGEGPYQWDIIMVANRIEGKKGILPVARLCAEKKYRMLLVGAISDPTYFEEVRTAAGDSLTFESGISDEQLRERYHQSAIHVCNSIDGFESGTMPILEAMACGTPVVTRRVGHVPDMFNGRNLMVRKSTPEDTMELCTMIQELLDTRVLRKELAQEGRNSLRSRSLDIYGRQMSKLYHEVRGTKDLVSVIIPTVAGPEDLAKTLAHVMSMPGEDLEIIVCDDTDSPERNEALIAELRKESTHTLKFYAVATFDRKGQKTYGLARARNKAILESEGTWLMFIDDRLHVDPSALDEFRTRAADNTWLWGVKDGTPKGFVENFSFVKRADLIRIGGFNEQITQYGGMTQEIRTRAELNKINFKLVETAKATAAYKSRSRWTKYSAIAKSKAQCYKLYG